MLRQWLVMASLSTRRIVARTSYHIAACSAYASPV